MHSPMAIPRPAPIGAGKVLMLLSAVYEIHLGMSGSDGVASIAFVRTEPAHSGWLDVDTPGDPIVGASRSLVTGPRSSQQPENSLPSLIAMSERMRHLGFQRSLRLRR